MEASLVPRPLATKRNRDTAGVENDQLQVLQKTNVKDGSVEAAETLVSLM